ncbi:hypothetical protein J8I87_23790 [Paraburkholderia sp. LEh10]|uniref:hypothetical protein n=1 Tax=Paraburkholderia sp. LEh10 TaxID=2821353 RepID=UPI001AE460C7|nr:hypothetical protein [Paraburkholderia sp. LEh10]MBP0592698.1 hypothetical protein [Paraburkholderia sp. LEh10]
MASSRSNAFAHVQSGRNIVWEVLRGRRIDASNCAGQLPGDFIACRQYTAMLSYQSTQFGVATSYDVMRGGPNASAPLSSSAFTDTRNLVDAYAMVGPVKVAGGWMRRNTAAAVHAQSDIFFLGFEYFIRPDLIEDVQALRYINRSVANANFLSPAQRIYFQNERRLICHLATS